MQTMRTDWIESPETNTTKGYWIEQDDSNPTFFPGRGAKVMFRSSQDAKPEVIGQIGVLHPEVMNYFGIPYAASAVEVNVEKFL